MMSLKKIQFIIIALVCNIYSYSQLGDTYDIERPEKYEDRKIGYEKTYTKKFSKPRKFIQNTISHYNFYYNANEKLNKVIESAKELNKDNYDKLLDYYPYSLNNTKTQKTDLDSVIQKASTGILIHDLRSSWVDNFYLLIGKAYLLQQKYDSAEMTFNYINYEYAPKGKDKERLLTGSKDNDLNGNNNFTISTKEKTGIVSKVFERPPSRNESFLWMLRTYIENEDYGSASGIVQILKNDPIFPKRLQNDLDELTGYLYYKQNMYDSAAHYVTKSLDMASGKNDKSRRLFLAGQLYDLGNTNNALAIESFNKCLKVTLDPVMDVYARLYSIRLHKGAEASVIEQNIAALHKMAKKDAYEDYQDIIYYFMGQMEMERNNEQNAINSFIKCTQLSNNPEQKNKAFLALAEIAYKNKKYKFASNYYDSINIASDASLKNINDINFKKNTLKQLVVLINIIEREDSLQTIAAMSSTEREEYLKKLVRRLRKEKGLKEDAAGSSFGNSRPTFNNNNSIPNLFDAGSGDWYFYNTTLKSRGNNEFKTKWGNRPNIDNWRRASAIGQSSVNGVRGNNNASITNNASNNKNNDEDISIEGLSKNIPLTQMMLKISNDTLESTYLKMAKLYQFILEDIPTAIETYETMLKRFPNHPNMNEIVYNMYLAYSKIGNTQMANQAKATLNNKFKDTKYTNILNKVNVDINKDTTNAYTAIYNLFIEGKFEQALQQKKIADSTFGANNWTPQLLYIEAIYYVKQRQDSLALVKLNNIIIQYPTSPLATKADQLKNVVSRRAVIETELSTLNVTRKEDTPIITDIAKTNNSNINNNSTTIPINKPVTTIVNPKPKDSSSKIVPKPANSKYPYKINNEKEQFVGVWLNKVDNVFTNEARNSIVIFNRQNPKSLNVENIVVDNDNKILVIKSFINSTEALSYLITVKNKMPTELMPWLAKDKYSVILISEENLALLLKSKNINEYNEFLKTTYPDKFQ